MTKISIAICTVLVLGLTGCSNEAEAKSAVATPNQSTVEKIEIGLLEERKVRSNNVYVHPEYKAAVSKQAKDLMGYEKSIYRGKHYRKKQESFRKCVMERESRYNYKGKNRVSSASGAYQFLDSQWRSGLVYMMIKESKKTDDGLKSKAKTLHSKPIKTWNRYWQDRAFFTAMNIEGDWTGKKHWRITVPGMGC
jgi:hypothetical protein